MSEDHVATLAKLYIVPGFRDMTLTGRRTAERMRSCLSRKHYDGFCQTQE